MEEHSLEEKVDQHVSVVHHDIRPFSCKSCKKAFASKQKVLRHLEKGCHMRKLEQFLDSQRAMAHSTTKLLLPKSAEHPNFEPQIPTPNIQKNETKGTSF